MRTLTNVEFFGTRSFRAANANLTGNEVVMTPRDLHGPPMFLSTHLIVETTAGIAQRYSIRLLGKFEGMTDWIALKNYATPGLVAGGGGRFINFHTRTQPINLMPLLRVDILATAGSTNTLKVFVVLP